MGERCWIGSSCAEKNQSIRCAKRVTNYSKHQQNIIKHYYENRDAIALQRVQELITELYLSAGKKRQRHWEQVKLHLAKLGLKQSQIDDLVAQDKPERVAAIVQKLVDKV
jgi:hypothetical protein